MLTQLTPAQLAAIAKTPRAITDMLGAEPSLCLDKMWNGLQFLLEPDGVDHAVIGGVATGPVVGYGPACVMTPAEVAALADELEAVDGTDLRARFDPSAMEDDDIYPSSIWSEGEPVLHELMTAFVDLVAFYRDAADRGNGVATYLT
jgi:hypothetical protein